MGRLIAIALAMSVVASVCLALPQISSKEDHQDASGLVTLPSPASQSGDVKFFFSSLFDLFRPRPWFIPLPGLVIPGKGTEKPEATEDEDKEEGDKDEDNDEKDKEGDDKDKGDEGEDDPADDEGGDDPADDEGGDDPADDEE